MTIMSTDIDVTVIIPTFNRAHLVERALESLARQTHIPAHVIVVDDGSTDNTPEAISTWARRWKLPLTLERFQTNRGVAIARNKGLILARTEYIAFLDSDDEYLPNALELLATPFRVRTDVALSFADATIKTPDKLLPNGYVRRHLDVERESRLIDPNLYDSQIRLLTSPSDALLSASFIPTCSTVFRRRSALKVGGIPDFRAGEDWLFWLRLTAEGSFAFQAKDVSIVHRHAHNTTHVANDTLTASEKLRGFAALLDGSLGIPLTEEQRAKLARLHAAQRASWRYHLSKRGLKSYVQGLHSLAPIAHQTLATQILADPKSLVRAILSSIRP